MREERGKKGEEEGGEEEGGEEKGGEEKGRGEGELFSNSSELGQG